MKPLKCLSGFFRAIVFVLVLGCAGTAMRESTGEHVSDSWITTKAMAALVEDPLVKGAEVNVETFKVAAQLSGFVISNAARSQAFQDMSQGT